MSDIFSQIPDPDFQAAEGLALSRLEERVVRHLLGYYQQNDKIRLLQQHCYLANGRRGLLFEHFKTMFTDFPVYLTFARVPYLHQLTMADWLTKFTKTGAFREFERQVDLVPEPWATEIETPLALVFPLYNMGTGLAVLSNCDRPLGEEHSRIAKRVRGEIYTFEPFQEFLEGLAWTVN